MDRLSRLVRRAERPEVFSCILFNPPGQIQAGKSLPQSEFQIRETFVIFQQEIELRLVLADEIILEECRFSGRVGQDAFHISGFRENIIHLHIRGGLEIRFHSIFEVSRFADINHIVLAVLEEVDAGFFRESLNFFF